MTEASETKEAARHADGAPVARWPARRIRVTLFLSVLLILGLWTWSWGSRALVQVHETDARIKADLVTLASRVPGRLVEKHIGSGRFVEQGQVLALIDARDAITRLEELRAELQRVGATRSVLEAQIEMRVYSTQADVDSALAELSAAQAMLTTREHEARYATRELERARFLLSSEVVSERDVDEAEIAALTAAQHVTAAGAGVATASATLGAARAGRLELEVLRARLTTLDSERDEIQARIERQTIIVSDHTLRSPIDGVVSRTFVDVGEYLQPGQRIALIHDPNEIYVEANIRETDVRRVEQGQTVRVEVDAYPDLEVNGVVERIGHAATSAFALLPNPTPSGQFTKVTQRLPVRIQVAQRRNLLRPGMMVEVFIHVGE